MATMSGVVLLGDSTVQHVKVGVPDHGHSQVLLQIIATDISPERRTMAGDLGLIDHALPAGGTAAAAIAELTGGRGCEASIDCCGSSVARVFALENTRAWGRCAFVGEGGRAAFAVSELLVHNQITLDGSLVEFRFNV